MLRALLIDLDGTLVDSIPSLFRVYTEFLAHYGIKGTREEFVELMGPSLRQIVDILRSRYHIEHSVEELFEKYNTLLEHCYAHELPLMPGAVETLSEASKHGVKLVLATSAPRRWVDALLKGKRLGIDFYASVTADDVNAGKPDPAIFRKGLELARVTSDRALVIDDAPAGIEAARRMGIFALNFHPGIKAPVSHGSYTEVPDWATIRKVLGW